MKKMMRTESLRLAGMIKKGVRDQSPGGKKLKPLAELTKKLKGSSKALIDKGDLLNSINTMKVSQLTTFIGVNKNKRGQSGQELMNIAEIMENGTKPFKIKVTKKMRGFWFHLFKKGFVKAPMKASTKEINHPGVPARPFMTPSYEEWSKDVDKNAAKIFDARLSKYLAAGSKWRKVR